MWNVTGGACMVGFIGASSVLLDVLLLLLFVVAGQLLCVWLCGPADSF